MPYTQAAFLADVRARLPEASPFLATHLGDDGYDSVHAVMWALADLVRDAARRADLTLLRRALDLADHAVTRPDADSEIPNAAQISFLEPHDLDLFRDLQARHLVSPALRALILADS